MPSPASNSFTQVVRRVLQRTFGKRQPQRRPQRPVGFVGEAPPAAYGGDTTTLPDMTYAPEPDGRPDPGEIVWAWVPFEEDHSQGKDRPVLIVGRDEEGWLVAVQLTSQDHDVDEEQERRAGRLWIDIGAGGWDPEGRPSEVRYNRLLRLDPASVRREGAVLAEARFTEVTAAIRRHYS